MYRAYINDRLIGPDGNYSETDQPTALTRGVAFKILMKAKKKYYGNIPIKKVKLKLDK